MNSFWKNIARYPQFFISSFLGLILVIIIPFRNLFKIPKFRIVAILITIGMVIITSIILKNMFGI